jgi:hypothetical protein
MTYGICVATYKDWTLLERFLSSLRAFPPQDEYRVYVVADQISEPIPSWLGMDVTLLWGTHPASLKHNIAVRQAMTDGAEYIIRCDDDIEFVHPGWAEALRECLEDDVLTASACATGRASKRAKQQVADDHDPASGGVRRVRDFGGFCFLTHRDAFDWNSPRYVGYFDTFHMAQIEDIDWCRRVRQMGFGVVICYRALVKHNQRGGAESCFKQALHNYRRKWDTPDAPRSERSSEECCSEQDA